MRPGVWRALFAFAYDARLVVTEPERVYARAVLTLRMRGVPCNPRGTGTRAYSASVK
jgi:hypothetical protein